MIGQTLIDMRRRKPAWEGIYQLTPSCVKEASYTTLECVKALTLLSRVPQGSKVITLLVRQGSYRLKAIYLRIIYLPALITLIIVTLPN